MSDERDQVAEMRAQKVVYLGNCEGNTARVLADEIDDGEVTHAVLAYRRQNGDTCYRLIGRDDWTYLIGMIERVKLDMHCSATYVTPEGGQ